MFSYGLARRQGQIDTVAFGDLVAMNEDINDALVTIGAGVILGSMLASGILRRTGPTGGYTDTTDTADGIVAALLNSYYYNVNGANTPIGISPNTSFRLRYLNTVAFAMVLAGGTGVTLSGGNTGIAASSVKDYLITILNGTPSSIQQANTINASAVVTGMNPKTMQQVTAGQLVSGTNIQAGSTVLSVQPGVGVTLSLTASGTATNSALTFGPRVQIESLGQMLL